MNNWNLLTFSPQNGWPLKMPPMPRSYFFDPSISPFPIHFCSIVFCHFAKFQQNYFSFFAEFLNSPLFPFIYYFIILPPSVNYSTNQPKIMPMPVDVSNSGEIVQQQIIFGDFSSAETEAEASSAFPLNSSTMEEDGADEVCTNSHIISANTIIHFTEDMDAVMFVMTVASSFLQLYVIFAALKHIRRKTSDKCMHVFLLSMTVADFLLTALCYPVELAPRAGLIQKFPRFVSAIMHMLCWIGLIVSSISLVFLNLDKLFFFRFPLRYSTCFTRARAIYLVTASWVLSTTFVLFAWATESFHCVDEDCITLAIFPNRLHIYLPFMICVGVIPTVTSLVVAIYIMKVVGEHRRQIKAQEHLLRTPRESSPSTQRSHSAMAAKMRTFYFIFMTTVFTAFTLLPYRFAGLQRSLNPQRTNECLTIFLYWLMMYLVYLNSMLNPLLTVTVLPQYRLNFMNILLCRRNKTKHQHEQYTSVNRISSDIL